MDIRGHDLGLLASLNVLIEEANVSKAAAKLGISQPALSAQLARLRDIFDDPLLLPASNGKGMVPTARAVDLRQPLRAALQALSEAVSTPSRFDPGTAIRTFTIAANDNAAAMLGVRLIARIAPRFPGVRIAFRNVGSDALPVLLESGNVDLAWVSRNAIPRGCGSRALLREEFRMAQRLAHPRGTGSVSLEEYVQLDHVIVSTTGGFASFVDELLAAQGRRRRVAASVPFYSLVPFILEATDLVCTLPARFLSRFPALLNSFPLPFGAGSFTMFATWHLRFDKDPGLQWLLKEIDGVARESPAIHEPMAATIPERG